MKTKAMELVKSAKGRIAAAGGIGSAITLLACNAMAVETAADLVGTADIAGVKTAVYTFLVLLVGIGVLFFGRGLLRRMGVSV